MTEIKNIESRVDCNLQAINADELAQIEGGMGAFFVGFVIGAAFVAGVAVGIQLAKQ